MPNIASVLGKKSAALPKKEVKAQVGKTQKASAQYRRDIANLKRVLGQQEKEIKLLKKRAQDGQPQAEEETAENSRFFGSLGESPTKPIGFVGCGLRQAGWRVGTDDLQLGTRQVEPRKAQLAALVAVRNIGKREAMVKLAELGPKKRAKRVKGRVMLNLKPVVHVILEEYALPWDGTHGVSHWARVLENGLHLAQETGASIEVVQLFAIFHDSRRINEGFDDGHGKRGAQLAASFHGELFTLADDQIRFAL